MGQIAGLVLVVIVVISAFVRGRFSCPMISKDKRPALVFVEGPADRSHLYVAHVGRRGLRREKIISSKSIEVAQLDNAVFLVTRQDTPQKGKTYVADLEGGAVKLLAEHTRINCLRTDPRSKKAMLRDVGPGAQEFRLIELDLCNFEMRLRANFKREVLGRWIGTLKVSPDFERIAYACVKSGGFPDLYGGCSLRVMDLQTMEIEELVDNIHVKVSGLSSSGWRVLAFDWVNNDEIVYKDMPGNLQSSPGKGLCIFKVVNIKAKKTSEVMRTELPLTMNGGSLDMEPFDGQMICDGKFILDLESKTLFPKTLPFSVLPDFYMSPTKILHGKDVLYSGKAACVSSCISTSGNNFAYLLSWPKVPPGSFLYAKFDRTDEPVKAGEGSYWPTRPIAWIE